MKKLKRYFNPVAEVILFIFALGVFCYSGYKIASYCGLLAKKALATESCADCSSCGDNGWLSDLCKKIRDWCQGHCTCQPTPTSPPPEPAPTTAEPTPTIVEPTPTVIEPTPTGVEPTPTGGPGEPTPTGQVSTLTPTPTSGVGGTGGEGGGGGGGGGGGPASPCTPPEAPKTPILLSAVAVSGSEVKLTWTKVDRATHYALAYGESSRHYIYGNANVGNTDSYTVGGLTTGKTYFFAVSAAIGGICPVASPYSNEMSARAAGVGGNILGAMADDSEDPPSSEGELGGGISTEAGEVAGLKTQTACPFWWIALLAQTIVLGGFYGWVWRRPKTPRFWWLVASLSVVIASLVDHYAHTHWFVPSRMCRFEPLLTSVVAILEIAGYRVLRLNRS